MVSKKINISNKSVAYNGARIGVAAVFAYSLVIMIYVILRSSITIYNIMPSEERNNILLTNGFSIAYSVAIFSLLMALLSSVVGAITAIMLKKSLLYFNPESNFRKTILISSIAALTILFIIYFLLYALLQDWVTFNYAETFLFWFIFPAFIFFGVCVVSGKKLIELFKNLSSQINHI
jgi:hypothetical protein